VPAQITREKAADRLDLLMPEWVWILVNQPGTFVQCWRGASGDSERTAYTMRDFATEVYMARTDAILHWYETGTISRDSAMAMLLVYVRDDVQARDDFELVLPPVELQSVS